MALGAARHDKNDLARIRRRVKEKEATDESLTITEAQVAILDWLASLGHKG